MSLKSDLFGSTSTWVLINDAPTLRARKRALQTYAELRLSLYLRWSDLVMACMSIGALERLWPLWTGSDLVSDLKRSRHSPTLPAPQMRQQFFERLAQLIENKPIVLDQLHTCLSTAPMTSDNSKDLWEEFMVHYRDKIVPQQAREQKHLH